MFAGGFGFSSFFRQRLARGLGDHLVAAHARLLFQQQELRVVQLLARRSVLGDPRQPQLFFQLQDPQFGPTQALLQGDEVDAFSYGRD